MRPVCSARPPACPAHARTFCRGQWCGSSRISLWALRRLLPGGARTSRMGARSCSPGLGLPGQECCRSWCGLSTWGHSLGRGRGGHVPRRRGRLFQAPAPLAQEASSPPGSPPPPPRPDPCPHLEASSSSALVAHRYRGSPSWRSHTSCSHREAPWAWWNDRVSGFRQEKPRSRTAPWRQGASTGLLVPPPTDCSRCASCSWRKAQHATQQR